MPRGGHPRTDLAVVHTTTALNRLDVMTVGSTCIEPGALAEKATA